MTHKIIRKFIVCSTTMPILCFMTLGISCVDTLPFSTAKYEDSNDVLNYRVQLEFIPRQVPGKGEWFQPRPAAVPPPHAGQKPLVIMTVQKSLPGASDYFSGLFSMKTTNLARTWKGPQPQQALAQRNVNNLTEAPADFTLGWHQKTRKILGIGVLTRYKGNKIDYTNRGRDVAYAYYDVNNDKWSTYKILEMPDSDRFFFCGAHGQWLFEPDGTVLIPIYFNSREKLKHVPYSGMVIRCRFDGQKLTFVEEGNELFIPVMRGLYEKSITCFDGTYYLTIRNDRKGYVTTSKDGLHFRNVKPWTFDDGSDLGSYNTHQKWVTHSDGLFLVYTRRGANNDHIFRHRAPLFIAKVDVDNLCVMRDTERIVVPERGYTIGNFDATAINENQSWVTVAGPDGMFISRIIWSRPNKLYGRVN